MQGERPDAASFRDSVIAELGRTFAIDEIDEAGFSLARSGRSIRVELSSARLAEHAIDIEESAHRALGIDPAWRSAAALVAVHITEEAAMATPGMKIVLKDGRIRRDPAPGSSASPGGGPAWTAYAPLRSTTFRASPEEPAP